MILTEFALVLLAVVVAFVFPRAGASWFEKLEFRFARLARRRRLAVVVVGLTALAMRAALLPIEPIPQPGVQDEFSYLLAADTFVHGRLANPTHPMWVHFETLAVIQWPTYSSKYPPAQALVLAAGRSIAGHAFWGVWLSMGVMCAAICWMLQSWLPAGWALLGGLLSVIRLGTFSYWANSYWGGAVAATGGALVLGALPRIEQQWRVRHAVLMGLGLGILANSRPYEGLVFGLPIVGVMLTWLSRKDRPSLGLFVTRVAVPMISVLFLALCAMGYYNWRVTGNPLRMPYQVYQDAYDPTPYIILQPPQPLPYYRHHEMRDWEVFRVTEFMRARSLGGFVTAALTKLIIFVIFYLGPLFSIIMLAAVATMPSDFRWKQLSSHTRLFLVLTGLSFAGLALEVPSLPHYAAPVTCLIYALIMVAMRRLRRWSWHDRPIGLAVVRGSFLACVMLLLLRAAANPLQLSVRPRLTSSWCTVSPPDEQNLDRASLLSRLEGHTQRQLTIVRYSPAHLANREWVYNEADIDNSKVIWARDMGTTQNEELIRYFKDRQVWLLQPDEKPPALSPYPDREIASEGAPKAIIAPEEK